MDLRQTQPDPRFRNRGYRKKRQVAAKRTRMDRTFDRQESSECSEGYFPEIESGSSDLSKVEHCYPEFEEEDEYPDDDECAQAYANEPYPSTSYSSGKFESLDMTDDVDEMGFPKYDRLGHIRNPLYGSNLSNSSGTTTSTLTPNRSALGAVGGGCAGTAASASSASPPVKPQRHKKRPSVTKRSDNLAIMYAEESGNEMKGGLSDDIAYSSEDSYAATYSSTGLWPGSNMMVVEPPPYPDFLSDNDQPADGLGATSIDSELAGVFIPPPHNFMEPDEEEEEEE